MEKESDEDSAIQALDGAEWMGRELKVNKARPKAKNDAKGSFGGKQNTSRKFSSW
jgi:RNA recognition motif-containing protein